MASGPVLTRLKRARPSEPEFNLLDQQRQHQHQHQHPAERPTQQPKPAPAPAKTPPPRVTDQGGRPVPGSLGSLGSVGTIPPPTATGTGTGTGAPGAQKPVVFKAAKKQQQAVRSRGGDGGADSDEEGEAEARFEKITVQDLEGVWLHSNPVLGKVYVEKNVGVARMGKFEFPLREMNDGTIKMSGWVAVPEMSTDSRIQWRGPRGDYCSWSWEGDDLEEVEACRSLISAAIPIPDLPGKRQRRQGVGLLSERAELVIRNPTPDAATKKALEIGKKRGGAEKAVMVAAAGADSVGGFFAAEVAEAPRRDQNPTSNSNSNSNSSAVSSNSGAGGGGSGAGGGAGAGGGNGNAQARQAARALKEWLLQSNTDKHDEVFITRGGVRACLPCDITEPSALEGLVRLLTPLGLKSSDISLTQSPHSKGGNLRISVSKVVREKFAQKYPEKWNAARVNGRTAAANVDLG